jgi:hypothetical protein
MLINHITNLAGKVFQLLLRIVKLINKKKLIRDQTTIFTKNFLEFTDLIAVFSKKHF